MDKNKKYFRVKIGYGADEFVSIEESELPMAQRAMITGKVASFNEGMVSGKSILSIIPDWQKVMGWKRGYSLQGEDYDYIGEKRVNEYREFISKTKLEVEKQLGSGFLLGNGN